MKIIKKTTLIIINILLIFTINNNLYASDTNAFSQITIEEASYRKVEYLIAMDYLYIPLPKPSNVVDSIDINNGTIGLFTNDLTNNDVLFGKGNVFTTDSVSLPSNVSNITDDYIKNNLETYLPKYFNLSPKFDIYKNQESNYVRTVNTYGTDITVNGYSQLLQILDHIFNYDPANKGNQGTIDGDYLRDVYKAALKGSSISKKKFKEITGVDISNLPNFSYDLDTFSYQNFSVPFGGLKQKVWYTSTYNGKIGVCNGFNSVGECITDVKPSIDKINGQIDIPYSIDIYSYYNESENRWISLPYFFYWYKHIYQENSGGFISDKKRKVFCVVNDDGFRMYINGVKIIDKWKNQAANLTCKYVDNLNIGYNSIHTQYFDIGGDKVLNLTMGDDVHHLKHFNAKDLVPSPLPPCGNSLFNLFTINNNSYCIMDSRLVTTTKNTINNLHSLSPIYNGDKIITGYTYDKSFDNIDDNSSTKNKLEYVHISTTFNKTGNNFNKIEFLDKTDTTIYGNLYEITNNPNYKKCIDGEKFNSNGGELNNDINIFSNNTYDKMENNYLNAVLNNLGSNINNIIDTFNNGNDIKSNIENQINSTGNVVSSINFNSNTNQIKSDLTPQEYLHNTINLAILDGDSDNNISLSLNDTFNGFVKPMGIKKLIIYDLTSKKNCQDNNISDDNDLDSYKKTEYYINSNSDISFSDIQKGKDYIMNYDVFDGCGINEITSSGIKSLKQIADDLYSSEDKNFVYNNNEWTLIGNDDIINSYLKIEFTPISNWGDREINTNIYIDSSIDFDNYFNSMMSENEVVCKTFINFNIDKDAEIRNILNLYKNFLNDVKKIETPYTMDDTSLGSLLHSKGFQNKNRTIKLKDKKVISGFSLVWDDPWKHCGNLESTGGRYVIKGSDLKIGVINFLNYYSNLINNINSNMSFDELINFANLWEYDTFNKNLLIAKKFNDNDLKISIVNDFKNEHNYKKLLNDFNIDIRGKTFSFKGINNTFFNNVNGIVARTCNGQSFLGFKYLSTSILKSYWSMYDESVNDLQASRNNFMEQLSSEIDLNTFNKCVNDLQANGTTTINIKNFDLNSLVNNSNYKYLKHLNSDNNYYNGLVKSFTSPQTIIGNLYKDIEKFNLSFQIINKDGVDICNNLLKSEIKIKNNNNFPEGFDKIIGFSNGNFTYNKFYSSQKHRSLYNTPNFLQTISCDKAYTYDKNGNKICDTTMANNGDLNRKDVVIAYKPIDKNKKYWISVEMLDINSFLKNKDTGTTKNEFGSLMFSEDMVDIGNYDTVSDVDKIEKECIDFKGKYDLKETNDFYSDDGVKLIKDYYNKDKYFTYKDSDNNYHKVKDCDEIKQIDLENKYNNNITCKSTTEESEKLTNDMNYHSSGNLSHNDIDVSTDEGNNNLTEQLKQANEIGGEKEIVDGKVEVSLTNEDNEKQKGLNIQNQDQFTGDIGATNQYDVDDEYNKLGLNVTGNEDVVYSDNTADVSNLDKKNDKYLNTIDNLATDINDKDRNKLNGEDTFLGEDTGGDENKADLSELKKTNDKHYSLITMENCVGCNESYDELRTEAEQKAYNNKSLMKSYDNINNTDDKILNEKVDVKENYKYKSTYNSDKKEKNIIDGIDKYTNDFDKTFQENKDSVQDIVQYKEN